MLIASVFLIYMLFSILREHPFGVFFVLILSFFPGLVFLYLSCVRAGLVAIKASGPPNIKKLGLGTIRLFRFNIMLNNLIIMLVGVGGSVLFMNVMTPELWGDLTADFEVSDLADLNELLGRFSRMPTAIILLITLAISVSSGVIGTSSAAVAATAADKGPNHHTLWGITRQFFPLFVLSMLVLWVPTLALVMSTGGPMQPMAGLGQLSIGFFLGLPFYLVWAGCAICGGKALAYAQTVKDMEREWVKERDDMLGDIVPEDNIRALRLERQRNTKIDRDEV